MKTYTELTPQERSHLIATKVLGWKLCEDCDDQYEDESGGWLAVYESFFDSDLNACHLVEEKMHPDGKWQSYMIELLRIVEAQSLHMKTNWRLIHATASQKTEAILRAYNLIS